MKQINIVQAYKNLETLKDIKDYHSKEQWALYCLRKNLRPHVEFYEERANEILNKYYEFADENGLIEGKPYQDYMKEINELNDLDVEVDFEKTALPFVDGISFDVAESLEDFIDFTFN